MSALFDRLLKSLPSYLDRSGNPASGISLVYAGTAARVTIERRALKTTISGGIGVGLTISLVGKTLTALVTELNGYAGYTAVAFGDGSAPAMSLIEVSGQDLTTSPRLDRFTSLLWSMLLPISWALLDTADNINTALLQMTIKTAEEKWLDLWGDYYGDIRRHLGSGPIVVVFNDQETADHWAVSFGVSISWLSTTETGIPGWVIGNKWLGMFHGTFLLVDTEIAGAVPLPSNIRITIENDAISYSDSTGPIDDDPAYRERIIREVLRWRLNNKAIEVIIKEETGLDTTVINLHPFAKVWNVKGQGHGAKYAGYKYSPTTFEIRVTVPPFETARVQKQITLLIERNRAAGTMPFYLFTELPVVFFDQVTDLRYAIKFGVPTTSAPTDLPGVSGWDLGNGWWLGLFNGLLQGVQTEIVGAIPKPSGINLTIDNGVLHYVP